MASAPPVTEEPPSNEPPANEPPVNNAPPVNEPPSNEPPSNEPPAPPANDDWRAELAGEDPEVLKFMGRYASKDAAFKEFRKIHGEIRSGKYIKPLGEDASDEDKAAWNRLLGVPDKPEAYLEKLPDGLVIGEDDKPAVDAFLKSAHEAGMSTAQAHATLKSYYDIVDEQMGELSENNNKAKGETEEALRAEWGADYKRNVNVLSSYVGTLPEEVSEALVGAVDENGVQLLNKPEVVKWLLAQHLDANPLVTVVPGQGANQASAIADEIAAIETLMRENRPAYNRDEAKQQRYRDLLTAREKISARGG